MGSSDDRQGKFLSELDATSRESSLIEVAVLRRCRMKKYNADVSMAIPTMIPITIPASLPAVKSVGFGSDDGEVIAAAVIEPVDGSVEEAVVDVGMLLGIVLL